MVDLGFIFLFFILGLSVGSFLNVLIDRIPRGESLTGRSHCDSCREPLRWLDLIPLASFLLLKGKCRYCQSTISLRYPFVELLTGILYVLTFTYAPNFNIILPYSLIMMSIFIVIFFSDLLYGIIPDKILFSALAASLLYFGLIDQDNFTERLLAALGSFSLLGSIFLFTKGKGMGFGDVKLAFLIGFFLGWPLSAFSLYFSFLTGGVISVMLLLYRVKRVGETVPFGPFLVLGAVVLYFGQEIVLGLIRF